VKISKIEPQKRNSRRCSIYCDGEYKFGLTKDIVLKYDLKEGDELSDDEIKNILLEEEKQKIKQRAYRLLNFRARSTRELKNRLLTIGFDPRLVDTVIEDLLEDNTLDDERFVKAFINDYTIVHTKGNIFIIRELKKKGIPQDTIMKMLETRDERALIKAFISKKLSHLNKHEPKERQKIIRRLMSRGFTAETIFGVINNERDTYDE
jgi:regulatory protein